MSRVLLGTAAVLIAAYGLQVLLHWDDKTPDRGSKLVPVTSANDVLTLIEDGKSVLFVDAREEREWQEEHIPGALNLTLRDVANLEPGALRDPDLIIAYCLKDFRGIEVAKALGQAGYPQAGILEEFGLKGWKGLGLPTMVAGRRTDEQAAAMLLACARDRTECGGGMQ